MMTSLINRKERMRLLLLAACALGCTCATVSGTFAALSYSAHPNAPAAAERLA